MSQALPAVEFRSVSKRYGAVTAVDTVSFIIEKGSLVTLLGPSGCGKTSTLRLIAGLDRASGGSILINGADVTHLSATDRDVSMVFQSYALFPHMTALGNVMTALGHAAMTILFVEHDMDIVQRYASRVVAFYAGRIVADGPPATVLADDDVRRYVTGELVVHAA